ncbi:MAG: hypothetical protein RLZZ350_845 [Verrucomicrobiota bacterium]
MAVLLMVATGVRAAVPSASARIERPVIEKLKAHSPHADKLELEKYGSLVALKRRSFAREQEFRQILVRADRRATSVTLEERPVAGRHEPLLQQFGALHQKTPPLGQTYSIPTMHTDGTLRQRYVRDTLH